MRGDSTVFSLCPLTQASWYPLKTHSKGLSIQHHEVSEAEEDALGLLSSLLPEIRQNLSSYNQKYRFRLTVPSTWRRRNLLPLHKYSKFNVFKCMKDRCSKSEQQITAPDTIAKGIYTWIQSKGRDCRLNSCAGTEPWASWGAIFA